MLGCKGRFTGIKSGSPAPDFVLIDLEGKPVKLSELKGNIVILEFWATWCPPCKMAIPELNDIHTNNLDNNVIVLGISVDEEIPIITEFMEHYEVLYPVLFDDQEVASMYSAYSIPTTVVIGKDGTLLKHHMGYAPGVIEELLAEAKAAEKAKVKKGQ